MGVLGVAAHGRAADDDIWGWEVEGVVLHADGVVAVGALLLIFGHVDAWGKKGAG